MEMVALMEMVAADWLKSDKREDDLGGRPGGTVQKYAAQGGDEFFFIVNIQVPGSTTYSLALYYMMNMPVESGPLVENFVRGDDAYRNSRKTNWISSICLSGNVILDSEGIASAFRDYYATLLGKETKPLLHVKCNSIYEAHGLDLLCLDDPFTMTEVFEVIRRAKNFKTPGPDGLNMEFYKKFWPLIGN
ncbi:protein ENHANCED DISEASE RESISTANCE 2-like [Canna indica]|uniref:Protein ENHANCED DISEASE RESISTANCE 2-like n=1 Tax=Canna indica TaxID=4628 RepID=A0AAQ3QCH2_9LILI|nr:protein ENHANCED DISEASE RESISTANCE 2-like [Canna indica]